MVTTKSTPLDAPLFQMDPDRGVEYWGCKAVMAAFTVAGDVADLVPRGLRLESPTIGAVLVADYGASTLGPYSEFVSLLRVVDDDDVPGLYVPYIYVTDDAALAAGREVLGAPKKLASIGVEVTPGAVVGTLARPDAEPLATVAVTPTERLDPELLEAFMPTATPFFSLRHLPGPPGATQVHELIAWNCELAPHRDAFGDELRFAGPASVTYPTHSAADPVHRLAVGDLLSAMYLEFDMRLTPGQVAWSETVPSELVQRPQAVGV